MDVIREAGVDDTVGNLSPPATERMQNGKSCI